MKITYDPLKNFTNLRKHRVSLADCEAVFHDPRALTREDTDHDEQRFVTLGMADSESFGSLSIHTAARTFVSSRRVALSYASTNSTRPDVKKEYDFSDAKRGAVAPPSGKTRITMMLDDDVLDVFRKQATQRGLGYQTLINEALRQHISGDSAPVTVDKLREVLREVLHPA